MSNPAIEAWLNERIEWKGLVAYVDTDVAVKGWDALRAILEIHSPQKIYDECDHEHEYDDPALIDTGEFTTCAEGFMYEICRACCTAGWDHEQTEDCANDHDHGLDKPLCPTTAAIAKALGIEQTAGANAAH